VSQYSLYGQRISETYPRLLQITSGDTVLDGSGDTRSLYVNGNFSADTIFIGSADLYNIFAPIGTIGSGATTFIRGGLNTYTGGTLTSPTVNISAATLSWLSATSISGDTIYSGGTDLYQIFSTLGSHGDIVRVQPGSNINTAGTVNAPIIGVVESPSFNNLTLSGLGQFNSVSASSLSATSIYSGNTDLYSVFATIGSGGPSTFLQPGLNTYTGGTSSAPSVNVSAATLHYLSATTVSGGTLYSGSTNLYDIFLTTNDGNDITRVQPGLFINTGGTASAPTINLAQNISGATISGGTFYSGSTPLQTIIENLSVGGSSTYVQPGLNTYTGGTSSAPTVNVSAATLTYLSATTVSGGTLYSGSTNLNDVFHRKSGYLLQKAGLLSGSTFVGSPRKSTVTFATPFANNLYSINVTGEINRTWSIESRTASGFTISSNSSTAFSSSVFWNCCEIGEGYR